MHCNYTEHGSNCSNCTVSRHTVHTDVLQQRHTAGAHRVGPAAQCRQAAARMPRESCGEHICCHSSCAERLLGHRLWQNSDTTWLVQASHLCHSDPLAARTTEPIWHGPSELLGEHRGLQLPCRRQWYRRSPWWLSSSVWTLSRCAAAALARHEHETCWWVTDKGWRHRHDMPVVEASPSATCIFPTLS